MTKRDQIEVHEVAKLPVALLKEDTRNTQKQSRKVFNDLKENIRTHGFDEPLLVSRNKDGTTFTIRSGNHRYRAGKSLGMVEFPTIIHEWSELEAALQNVRRNVSRGAQDANAFTSLVDHLKLDFDVDIDSIQEGMAFADDEDFARLYQLEAENGIDPSPGAGGSRGETPDSAHKTKMLDDLGVVLSHIFDEFGGSVPCSFIIFPASGKEHMYVQATSALKKVIAPIAERCLQENIDFNVAMTGLLQIGISQTSFLQPKGDPSKVQAASVEADKREERELGEIK